VFDIWQAAAHHNGAPHLPVSTEREATD